MIKSILFSIWFLLHPVHVTLTSIDYIPENDSLKVFVRMYFDDFLLDYNLSDENINKEDFLSGNVSSKKQMEKYLGYKILIKVNERILPGELINLKIVDNEISMNLEYKMVRRFNTITVKNLIMTDLYEDQSNMVIVRVNNFEEGVKLTSDMTEQSFKIK